MPAEPTTLQLTVTRSPIELGKPVPDPLRPASGILRGIVLGLLLWLAGGVAWLVVRAMTGWLA